MPVRARTKLAAFFASCERGQDFTGCPNVFAVHEDFGWTAEIGDAVEAEIGGTGLGLRIVQTIADNHGGRLEIDSTEGQGTTARLVVRRVVEEIERKLAEPMRQAVAGALNRSVRNRRPRHNEIDWHRTIRDNLEAFELLLNREKPTIALCMGDEGLPSRVLARKFGAFTFKRPYRCGRCRSSCPRRSRPSAPRSGGGCR